jgi:hypothetical protein
MGIRRSYDDRNAERKADPDYGKSGVNHAEGDSALFGQSIPQLDCVIRQNSNPLRFMPDRLGMGILDDFRSIFTEIL